MIDLVIESAVVEIDVSVEPSVVEIDLSVAPSIYAVENLALEQRVSEIEDQLALPQNDLTAGAGLVIVGSELRYNISSLTRI
jgi:hypothetical protein